MNPRFPIFIPSRSRATLATTPHVLDRIGVPYRLIVEADQYDEYAEHFDPTKLLVLDPTFQRDYDALTELGDDESRGSGPARNFAWATAANEGAPWHWTVDDNITLFARLHQNERIPVGDGTIFHAMETFVLRYRNVAMAGPHYWMFAPSRGKRPPFITGTRIFSCNLIRTDLRYRWRGRYNEDTILSIDLLKAGWNTVLFNAFLQYKLPTGQMKGGNQEVIYADGTVRKSQMLVDAHPDVARLAFRYGRVHHHVDYSQWLGRPLVRRDETEPEPEYRMVKIKGTGLWPKKQEATP